MPDMPAVIENGLTLEANSVKKALAITERLGVPALADDSGIFIPSLGGKPGVKSARYAGPKCDYGANNRKLLKAMAKLTGRERRGYFATAMALTLPGKKPVVKIGKIWGGISETPAGENGFGYDPVFIPSGESRTFAEMTSPEKNKISHRALALQKIAPIIKAKLARS
jgi:XTP/dITP diphosphohydrolase